MLLLGTENEIIAGPPGSGKTSLAVASIVRTLADGGSALYITSADAPLHPLLQAPEIGCRVLSVSEDARACPVVASLGTSREVFVLRAAPKALASGAVWAPWRLLVYSRFWQQIAHPPVRVIVDCADDRLWTGFSDQLVPYLLLGVRHGVFLALIAETPALVPAAFRRRMDHIVSAGSPHQWRRIYHSPDPLDAVRMLRPEEAEGLPSTMQRTGAVQP